MRKIVSAYFDSVLGDFAWYRKWRGGTWHSEISEAVSGFAGGAVVWTREEPQDPNEAREIPSWLILVIIVVLAVACGIVAAFLWVRLG